MPEHLSLMGFDFGQQRIGVAVGQTITGTAQPVTTVATPQGAQANSWQALDELQQQWRPDRLVVGLPLTLEGGEQKLSTMARSFAKQLAQRYNLPVELTDERFSTQAAKDSMRSARQRGGRRKQVASLRDSLAATHILEQWLREHDSAQ